MDDGTTQVLAARRQTSSSLPVATNNITTDITTPAPSFNKSFTARLPPMLTVLFNRIQGEEFIDMAELTVDYLSMQSYDEPSKSTQGGQWHQSLNGDSVSFTQYIALLTQAKPERTTDLLGYQHLILQAHLEYYEDGWMVYDHRFWQIAATHPSNPWARRDGDLWNMTFGNS